MVALRHSPLPLGSPSILHIALLGVNRPLASADRAGGHSATSTLYRLIKPVERHRHDGHMEAFLRTSQAAKGAAVSRVSGAPSRVDSSRCKFTPISPLSVPASLRDTATRIQPRGQTRRPVRERLKVDGFHR